MILLVATWITAVLSPVVSSVVLTKVPLLDVGVRSKDKLVVDSDMDKVVSLAMEVPVTALILSSYTNSGGLMNTMANVASIAEILVKTALIVPGSIVVSRIFILTFFGIYDLSLYDYFISYLRKSKNVLDVVILFVDGPGVGSGIRATDDCSFR